MKTKLIIGLLSFSLLTACGGSGGGGGGPAPQPPAQKQLSGMAAEGNPLVNTTVEVRGSNGQTTSTQTDASGKFTANVSNLDYPMMVKAVGTNSYYSTSYGSSYINVTPLTTLALAALVGTHPDNIFSNFTAATLKDSTELYAASVLVVQKFSALANISNMDFFTYQFNAVAGDSYDDLLEALKADLLSSGKTLTQVANEIVVANNPDPGCPTGQHKENNVCVASIRSCPINNGVGEQVHVSNYWNACQVVSCNTNYSQTGQLCLPSSRECTTLPSNAVAGTETWSGSAWGACQIRECATNYTLASNACTATGTPPVTTSLSITDTGIVQAHLDLRSLNLGTKTLYLSRENDTQDGFIVDSTSTVKTFIDPNPTVYGYFASGALMGNDLWYQLSETQVTGKLSLYKVDSTTGGTSTAVHLDNAVAGYNSSARSATHTMGTNVYYRAQQGSSALAGTAIYKYNPDTGVSTKVMADLSTYALTLKEKVLSGNLMVFHPGTDLTPKKYIMTAIGPDDQPVVVKELLMSDYECLSGQISPFNECNPVFLQGRAMIQFRHKATDNYFMLVTDGTVAGTSMIDIPFHYGGMANIAFMSNKMIFNALRKDNLSGGQQIYGYSIAEGFHLVKQINTPGDYFNTFTVMGITTFGDDAFIIGKKTTVAMPSYTISYSGQILKTQGSDQTTTTLYQSTSAEFLELLNANGFNRGPFVALKGHLVFTSSNQSNDSNSPVALKSYRLSDETISTIRSDFTGHITYYGKDKNSDKIIVSEKVTNVNNAPAKILIVE